MSRRDAQVFYERGPGEPAEGYVTPEDAKASVGRVYADMAGLDAAAPIPLRWKGGNASVWNYGEYADTAKIVSEVQTRALNVVTVPVRILADDIYDSTPTVDAAHLAHAQGIAAALPAGTKIIAEPYPYIDSGQQSETLWNPSNKSTWFTNWAAACTTVAEAFPQAEAVYIGSNFVEMEAGYETEWADVVGAVRAVTSAEVMYRCNFWYENVRLQALKDWGLLDLVDVIAVAAYFELTDTASPDYDEVRSCLDGSLIFERGQNIVEDVRGLSEAHGGKPIFFGELNCARVQYGTSQPWDDTPPVWPLPEPPAEPVVSTVHDPMIQQRLFRAYVSAFSPYDWWRGFSIYNIGGFGDSNYRLSIPAISYIRNIPTGE